MPEIYFCVTGNYLHHTRKYFQNEEECMEHVCKIIKMKEDWVTYEQANKSYQITKIDTDLFPSYKKVFKDSEKTTNPKPATKSERRGRKKRVNKKLNTLDATQPTNGVELVLV